MRTETANKKLIKDDQVSIADVEGNLVANCAGLHVDEEEADQVDRLGEIHCCSCRIRRRAFCSLQEPPSIR